MAPLNWPTILRPSAEAWNLNTGASRSGGRSLANQEQVVVGVTGYATASLTVPCNTRARVLAMRALLAELDGRAGTVRVGPFEIARAPWYIDPATGRRVVKCPGDNSLVPATDMDFRLSSAVAMNASTMTIRRDRGGFLDAGMIFGLGDRLHIIARPTTSDPVNGQGQAAPGIIGVKVRPWTLEGFPSSTPIEFAKPRAIMRLASDDTGALDLQLSRSGVVTLDLVEAI